MINSPTMKKMNQHKAVCGTGNFVDESGFLALCWELGFSYYSLEAYAVYYPEFLETFPEKQWSCHSTWLSMFGEHGFPGFFIWICLIVCCFLSLRKIRRYGQKHKMIYGCPFA